MLALLQYAGWYKGLFGMSLEHRPDNDVIDDDQRLDSWYETFVRKMSKAAGRQGDPNFSLFGDAEAARIPEFQG